MLQFGVDPPKKPTVFPANQESSSGLLDVQKNACKQLWRVWDMAAHKPNCSRGFYKLNPKYSPVTNFIRAIKIQGVGRNPSPLPRFPGNLMLKLVREKEVLNVRSTGVSCHSVLIISDVTLYSATVSIVFYSVVLNQWSADSWGSWTAWDACKLI